MRASTADFDKRGGRGAEWIECACWGGGGGTI